MKPIIFFLFIMILSFSGGLAHGMAEVKQNEDNVDMVMKYQGMDQNNDGMIARAEWQAYFDNHDWNGDGILSGDELRRNAGRYQGVLSSSDQFRRMDRNSDGVISRGEWTGTMRDFTRLDQDHNGNLSINEFYQSPGLYQFSELDYNNDGVISRGEWTGATQDFNRLDQDHNGNLNANEFYQRVGSDQFSEFDYNNDGVIAYDEWSPNSRRSFEVLDFNRDGKLTRDEFYNLQQLPVSAFRELDQDNNGTISRSEWRSTSEAFNSLDTNGDNLLSENEFNTRQGSSIAVQILQEIFKKR